VGRYFAGLSRGAGLELLLGLLLLLTGQRCWRQVGHLGICLCGCVWQVTVTSELTKAELNCGGLCHSQPYIPGNQLSVVTTVPRMPRQCSQQ
jgi:hypothetical protein